MDQEILQAMSAKLLSQFRLGLPQMPVSQTLLEHLSDASAFSNH